MKRAIKNHIKLDQVKDDSLSITYGIHRSPFGWCGVGVTKLGICHLSFLEKHNPDNLKRLLQTNWPKASLIHDPLVTRGLINKIFKFKNKNSQRLIIKGTKFQIKVWQALTKIPFGKTSSYSQIAKAVGAPKAVRAVGSACGRNSIAFVIPCHRVLTSSGKIGGYRWGIKRKQTMLAWEAIHNH